MDLNQRHLNGERLRNDFEELALIGTTPSGGVTRLALSLEDLEARAWFANRIEEAGLFVHDDDVGNLSGIYSSKTPNAPTLILGSHLDTVPNGGLYDGSIGVLAGLECLRTLHEAQIDLPFHLEVMNFTDEEGTWFSLLGSRGLTGTLPQNELRHVDVRDGAFRAALLRSGIELERVHLAARERADIIGYLELHIEQSTHLEKTGSQIGIVRDIVGRNTSKFIFRGSSGHSGTTERANRRDALQGAALFVTQAHQMVQSNFDGGLVNCGNLSVLPGRFNMIPSQVDLLVECRHRDENTLAAIENALLQLAEDCASSHRLALDHRRVEHIPAAHMDETLVNTIQQVCDALEIHCLDVVSYSGHDAQVMQNFTPTGMIFVPCVNGISHSPAEYSHWEHIELGANVLFHTVMKLAATYSR
jgi:hydantoinase/carbamoylase family amidase